MDHPQMSVAADSPQAGFAGRRVVVAGLGASGYAAADALLEQGAAVVALDDADSVGNQEKAKILETLGAEVRLGAGASAALPPADLVIASPGWPMWHPLFQQAQQRGTPIWGEVELAWRLRDPSTPWLGVTGTNGKTTTTSMLAAMLAAAGLRTAAVGNIGRPIMEAVLDEFHYDVLAVELSSFQLHWAHSVSLHSAVVLNVEPDHMEWYAGDMGEYTLDKGRIYQRVQQACVYNVADPTTERLVVDADVVEGARAIGFTLGVPAPSMLGVVDGLLVDRAFIPQRRDSAVEIAKVSDVRPAAPHNVANALAAAALARSFGVHPKHIAEGLRSLEPGDHRIQLVAEVNSVRYVDDSKATNPHAAAASLAAFDSVVWIAGGQAKGVSFDDLVAQVAPKLRGVALLGVDQDVIARALAQHAPDVPVFATRSGENEAMRELVGWAASIAAPGDVVLLAPGCASRDMYVDYAARGDSFAAEVRKLG
ncbi:MAG: UDP-N-acetylmuramoyl-L-alanine--D-glutamate ligase [Propionibacteriaceae bacterium]|jgi:UDP-N-acetylmuramoylalanine--D-glutamate ligase|nr:UDP-N-acetylmuramoyl-L-alanine--D-glutamate ligase [Propionibacteriaceae bacterium]